MGIDHKLEGRKSKDVRTGKWKRQKGVPAPVKPVINVKGKATVVFNEQARNEWLTGFGKRKADRRKYGLAMQIIKDKRTKKDTLKQIRAIASNDHDDDDDTNDINDILNDNHTNNTNDNNENDDRGSATLFDDDETQGMFGGAVTVVVDAGVSDEIDHLYKDNDDDNDDDDDTRSISSYRSRGDGRTKVTSKETKESSLQRAMKEVAKKNLLTKKKKFNTPNPFPKGKRHVDSDSSSSKSKKKRGGIRSSGKVLMNKALGGQKFKGSHKGRRPANS